MSLLRIVNLAHFSVLKLDGCQVDTKCLDLLKQFLKQQHKLMDGVPSLQYLSLSNCGIKLNHCSQETVFKQE